MSLFDKIQPILVVLSVVVGLVLARFEWLTAPAAVTIAPLLAVMLYATFLPMPLKQFGRAGRNLKVTTTSLAMNFLWTPVFAWGLGALFLYDTPDLWLGLIMLMVTPCTDWYLIFTGIAGGDVALAIALLPINLVLQILLLPLYLLIFAGTLVELDPQILLSSVVWILVIPLLMAIASRKLVIYCQGNAGMEKLFPKMAILQVLCLNLAIMAIFTSEGNVILQRPELLLKLLLPVILFFFVNLILGQGIGRCLQFSNKEIVCLNCTTLARNSPISLAIAASTFPHRPLIALTLAIGPLIELPILVIISQILLFIQKRK